MECGETVNMVKFSEHHKNEHAQGGNRGNDSEEEEKPNHQATLKLIRLANDSTD